MTGSKQFFPDALAPDMAAELLQQLGRGLPSLYVGLPLIGPAPTDDVEDLVRRIVREEIGERDVEEVWAAYGELREREEDLAHVRQVLARGLPLPRRGRL